MRDINCKMFDLDNTLYNISEKIIKTDEVLSLLLKKKKELKFLNRKYNIKVQEVETFRNSCEQLQKNLFNCLEKYTPIEKEWKLLKDDKSRIDKICTDAEIKIQEAVKSQVLAENKSEKLLKEINDLKEKEHFLIKEKNDTELFLKNNENDCKRAKALNKRLLELFKKYLSSKQKSNDQAYKENNRDLMTEVIVSPLKTELFPSELCENQNAIQKSDKELSIKHYTNGKFINCTSRKTENLETFSIDLSFEDMTILKNLEAEICHLINEDKSNFLDDCKTINSSSTQSASESNIKQEKSEKSLNPINSLFSNLNNVNKEYNHSQEITKISKKNKIYYRRNVKHKTIQRRCILLKMLICKCHQISSLLKGNKHMKIINSQLYYDSIFKTKFLKQKNKSKRNLIFITDKLLYELKMKLYLLYKCVRRSGILIIKKEINTKSISEQKIQNKHGTEMFEEDSFRNVLSCNDVKKFDQHMFDIDLNNPLFINLSDVIDVAPLLSPLSAASSNIVSENNIEFKYKYDIAVGVDEIIPNFIDSSTQTYKINQASCSVQVSPMHTCIETQTSFNTELICEHFEESIKQNICNCKNKYLMEQDSTGAELISNVIKSLNLKEKVECKSEHDSVSIFDNLNESIYNKSLRNKIVNRSILKSNSGLFVVSDLKNRSTHNIRNLKIKKRCLKCKFYRCCCNKNLKSLVFSMGNRLTKLSGDYQKLMSQISNHKINKSTLINNKNCDNANNLVNKESSFKVHVNANLHEQENALNYSHLNFKESQDNTTNINEYLLPTIDNKLEKITQNISQENNFSDNIISLPLKNCHNLDSKVFSISKHYYNNYSSEVNMLNRSKQNTMSNCVFQQPNDSLMTNNELVYNIQEENERHLELNEKYAECDKKIEINDASNVSTYGSKLVTNMESNSTEITNKVENTTISKSLKSDSLNLLNETSVNSNSQSIIKNSENDINYTCKRLKAMHNDTLEQKINKKSIVKHTHCNDKNKSQFNIDKPQNMKNNSVKSKMSILFDENTSPSNNTNKTECKNNRSPISKIFYTGDVLKLPKCNIYSESNETQECKTDYCIENNDNKKKRKGKSIEKQCKRIKKNKTDKTFVTTNDIFEKSTRVSDSIETSIIELDKKISGNSNPPSLVSISDNKNKYLSKEAIETRSQAQLILKMKPCKTQNINKTKTEFKSSLSLRNRSINLESPKNTCKNVNQELHNIINSQNNITSMETDKIVTKTIKVTKNNVKKMTEIATSDEVILQINKLLENWSDINFQEVSDKIKNVKPSVLAHLMINIISSDVNVELDKTFTPPAPPLTSTQQKILILISDLESRCNISTLQIIILMQLQTRILSPTNNLWILGNLTRIFIAICRLKFDVERARLLCCDVLYKLKDKAIPVIFIILTSWPEVLPCKESNNGNALIEVIVQVIFLKKCLTQGYNLRPLHELLTQFYNYKKGEILPSQLCNNLIEQFKKQDSQNVFYAILLLAKNQDSNFTYQQVLKKHLLPFVELSFNKIKLLSENAPIIECVSLKKNVYKTLDLIGKLSLMFEAPNDNEVIKDIHTQLLQLQENSNFLPEDLTKELIKVSNYFQ